MTAGTTSRPRRVRYYPARIGIALCLMLTLSTGAARAAAPDTQADQVAKIARDYMAKNGLKSAIVRVTVDDKVLLTTAMGESMTGVPATPEMHFRIGAVAIAYLGIIYLQMVEEGKFSPDDKLAKWLPDMPKADRVTLRMLISSTSGYPDYVYDPAFQKDYYVDHFRHFTPQQLVGYVAAQPLLYEPGTNWSYAHTNFVLLGLALEKMTGQPLAQIIRDRVVVPLGLSDTESADTAVMREPVLHAFTAERDTYEESTFWNPSWTIASGMIMTSNIYDVERSARAFGSGTLLSKAAYKAQIAPTVVGLAQKTDACPACLTFTPERYFGIGVVIQNGWVLQNPSFGGYSAVAAYHPGKRIALAISVTMGPTSDPAVSYANGLFDQISALLAADTTMAGG